MTQIIYSAAAISWTLVLLVAVGWTAMGELASWFARRRNFTGFYAALSSRPHTSSPTLILGRTLQRFIAIGSLTLLFRFAEIRDIREVAVFTALMIVNTIIATLLSRRLSGDTTTVVWRCVRLVIFAIVANTAALSLAR